MGPGALVDSNILIDHMNGIPQATAEIRRYRDRAVSLISWIEIMTGLPEDARSDAESLLRHFELIQITEAIARETVHVRRTSRLKLPDAVLLATARVENRVLVTRNTKDFKPGQHVRVPYKL